MLLRNVLLSGFCLPVLFAGCATSPYAPEPGPRTQPDPNEWKRKSVPLPPLYWRFTTSQNNQWTMATPLYWQVIGAESKHQHLVPLASYAEDRSTGESGGHVLTWFWGKDADSSYRVGFPFYWHFARDGSETNVYGPLYRRHELGAVERHRTVLMPWLYSREHDSTGYDYWSVFFRLVGYEKQIFDGERKERLWLFFVLPIPIV